MDGKKRFVPRWLMRSEEPLRQNVMLILDKCNAVRKRSNGNGGGDEADFEAAKTDLKDALTEIFLKNGAKTDKSPLWDAVMMIRPQVINSKLPTSVTEEVAEALWSLKEETGEKEAEKSAFYGRLAGRLRKHQINFFRAVISGGTLTAKEKDGEWRNHYFPGISLSVRTEAGVKLSTSPENVEPVIKAYKLMAGKTTGNAKTAIDAVTADIEELSKHLYPPKKQ